jgi:hypothetical protein
MNRSKQVKVIRDAYYAIPDLQDGFLEVRERLFDMNKAAEKQHRRGAPDSVLPLPLTIKDAARYFVVRHLLDGFKEPDRFSVDDIINIRNEVLYAQAYAKRFHKELEAWYALWNEQFAGVDYVELMKAA